MRLQRLWAAVVVIGAVVALAAGAARALADRSLATQLMRADPDAAAAQPRLAAYAARAARPDYARHCAACHGERMGGDARLGAPDLADADWLYGSGRAAEIEQTILYGVRSGAGRARNLAVMPAFGRQDPSPGEPRAPLTPGEIADVTAYVLSLRDHPGSRADPDQIARGRQVFTHQGACFDCHAPDGGGDPAIGAPNLTDGVWLYGDGSAASVAASIARGRRGVCPAWSGRLPPATVRALAVYLHNAARSAPAGGRP